MNDFHTFIFIIVFFADIPGPELIPSDIQTNVFCDAPKVCLVTGI